MAVKTEVPSGSANVEADLARLVSAMDCQTLRSLAAGAPPPDAMLQARECGTLNRRHLPALLVITFAGPLSVSDLAARLGHGLPTTSTLVGELSRAGLIERSECPVDRRRTMVGLEQAHRDQITAWAFGALGPLRRTLERLTPVARAHFIDGWQIFHQEAERTSCSADDPSGAAAPNVQP